MTRTDPRNDGWEPRGLDGWAQAESVPNVDLLKFRIRNAAKRVVVVAHYTGLVANDDELHLVVDLKTASVMRSVSAEVSPVTPTDSSPLSTSTPGTGSTVT